MKHLRILIGACVSAALLAACGDSNGFSSPTPTFVARQPLTGTGYKSLYSFKGGSKDGASPVAGLLAINGELYGTTEYGGSKGVSGSCGNRGCGTVFKMDNSGKEKVLHYFEGPAGRDGAFPVATLADMNGTLYGTTEYGGACISSCGSSYCNYSSGYGSPCGTIFAISKSGEETVLYSFRGSPDGANPAAGLMIVNGLLYGTTKEGGEEFGTVFKISSAGEESVQYSFGALSDGWYPVASLVAVNGSFYGTTSSGGKCSPSGYCLGTVFEVSASGTERIVHYFKDGDHDGAFPLAGVIAVNGTLYGTTSQGGVFGTGCGSFGCGTIFEISTSGREKLLYRFKGGADGAYPSAKPTDVNGVLYGTTSFGGAKGAGTVFKVTLSGTERVLYSFKGGKDGAYPDARLAYVRGALYGTTSGGGTHGAGTVFRILP